ncbi:MAG: L,D-transpeptidase family protein [Chitinophagaceae bacterium]
MSKWCWFLCCIILVSVVKAQNNFIDLQKSSNKVANVFKLKEDTLKKQVEKAGLKWPLQQLYIRSFKYDSKLEVWARNHSKEPYQLFKTYKVCALSGALGPKRMEGDYQVPEGFYTINEFKYRSTYHLALGLNYPNSSDILLSDIDKPGGEIYIHGSCITVGCIPVQDDQIEELYILASHSKSKGQDFIPVHIFPIKFDAAKSVEYFNKNAKDNTEYLLFTSKLKQVFDYFELYKKLPIICINKMGEYVIM